MEALLLPVLRDGELVEPLPALADIRARAQAQREALPEGVRRLRNPEPYPVTVSEGIQRVMDEMAASEH